MPMQPRPSSVTFMPWPSVRSSISCPLVVSRVGPVVSRVGPVAIRGSPWRSVGIPCRSVGPRGDPWDPVATRGTEYWLDPLRKLSGTCLALGPALAPAVGRLTILLGLLSLAFARRRQARLEHVGQAAGAARAAGRLLRPDDVAALDLGGHQFLQSLAVAIPVLRRVEVHRHRADQGDGHLHLLRVHLDIPVKEREGRLADLIGPQ